MKRSTIFFVCIIVLVLVLAIGANHWYSIPTYDQLPVFPVSVLILLPLGFLTILSNPLWILFAAVACIVAYYVYDNFIRRKQEPALVSNITLKQIDQSFSSVVLFLTTLLAILTLFALILSANNPGAGAGWAMLLAPIFFVAYIFYPIYFIVLTLRYLREKGHMSLSDKIMFYLLLIGIGTIFVYVIATGKVF
jgi:hypothetical protein